MGGKTHSTIAKWIRRGRLLKEVHGKEFPPGVLGTIRKSSDLPNGNVKIEFLHGTEVVLHGADIVRLG